MRALVLNTGSSSIKYELFDTSSELSLLEGILERIGERTPHLTQRTHGAGEEISRDVEATDHAQGLAAVIGLLEDESLLRPADLAVVGHRVVHGGPELTRPVIVDDEVVGKLRKVQDLAPLHNPGNIIGIEAARRVLPDVPHVAVFDTGFHATIPAHAHRYAVPREWFERYGVRRYGFHGISHEYVASAAAGFLGRAAGDVNLITLHLGNGASAAAIRGGVCIDTSMGMTPLEGLVMGTRSGDIDPALPEFMSVAAGRSPSQIAEELNFRSGMLGLTGANDMREVQSRVNDGDDEARLALQIYCYRVKKYIGAYAAALGRLDAVVFTAGVGENDPIVRSCTCEGLGILGIRIDAQANCRESRDIRAVHAEDSRVAVLVVPTDEESQIMRQALECVRPGASKEESGS
jgi:acetate kinase